MTSNQLTKELILITCEIINSDMQENTLFF